MKVSCEGRMAIRSSGCLGFVAAHVMAKALPLVVSIVFCALPCWVAAKEKNSNSAAPPTFTAFGTWNGLHAMSALIQQYESERQSHFIEFTPIVTEQVPGFLALHECDLGMTLDSRVPETSKSDLSGFERFILGRFVVGVAANAKNRVRTITLDDLRRVFTGQTASWKGVVGSGSVAQIKICRPSATTTQGMIFQKNILLRCPFGPALLEPCADPQPEKKSDAEVVGAIVKQSNAIGFFLYRCEEQVDKRIHILRIAKDKDAEAVPPSASTVADGRYPLVDTLTLYVHPDAPPSAREFIEFATGPEAAKLIKQSGLWPEYDLEKVRGEQRVAEVKGGKGAEIVVGDLTGWADVLKDLSLKFVKAKAAVQLKFQKGETRNEAVEKLNKGATELLLLDGPLTEGEGGTQGGRPHPGPLPKGEGKSTANPQSPRSIELGRTAVGVIVHPENPLESLPLDEAKSIFCGEVKKWPAVRGAAAAMRVFGLKHTDPMTQLLKEKLVERGRSLKYNTQPDNEKVILAVARDPAAIGFVDMSQLPPNEKSVKLVPVLLPGQSPVKQVPAKDTKKAKNKARGGKKDASEYVLANAKPESPNPLSRTLTLYVSPNASQVAKDFADFLTPEHCKETIAQYNLLPPLHAENAKLASRPHPNPLPKGEGVIDLTSADEPIPLLLDDPDAPQTPASKPAAAKLHRPSKPAQPEAVQPDQSAEDAPAPSDPKPANTPPPLTSTSQSPNDFALSDNQLLALIGVIGGVIVLAYVLVGRLRAPKHKRPHRHLPY